jgi:tetratricopeptide (TPR) repeat protein
MPFASFNLCLLLGAALGKRKKILGRDSIVPIGLALLVVVAGWAVYWMRIPYSNGLRAAEKGETELAARHFRVSVQREPNLVLSHQQLGLAESLLAFEGDVEALKNAIQAFERVVILDPAYSPHHANLGALYQATGDYEKAAESFNSAVKLAPKWATWHLNLGEVYEIQALWDFSAQSYKEALSLEPGWALDEFWNNTPFRGEVLASWQDSISVEFEEPFVPTEWEAVHQTMAGPILEVAARNLKDGDLNSAERLLNVAPLSFFPIHAQRLELIWLNAELYAAQGQWQTALDLGEEALEGFQIPGAYGPGSSGKSHYADGIFRRNTMRIELVPHLTLIQYPEPWPDRMFTLSVWYMEAGDPEGCEMVLEEILDYVPDFMDQDPGRAFECQ